MSAHLRLNTNCCSIEALSSDEDEMDEMAPNYLDKLADFAKTKGSAAGFEVKAELKDDNEDSDDEAEESIGDLNETGLETFTTPIDDEENESAIDEYWTFKEVITGKRNPNFCKISTDDDFSFSTFRTRSGLVLPADLKSDARAS